jgi:hypothetical protein
VATEELIQAQQMSRPGQWHSLSSSRVADCRWDGGLRQIHVHFADGTPWVYEDVDYSVFKNLRRSSSPGRFVNRVLNRYPYHRGPSPDFPIGPYDPEAED